MKIFVLAAFVDKVDKYCYENLGSKMDVIRDSRKLELWKLMH